MALSNCLLSSVDSYAHTNATITHFIKKLQNEAKRRDVPGNDISNEYFNSLSTLNSFLINEIVAFQILQDAHLFTVSSPNHHLPPPHSLHQQNSVNYLVLVQYENVRLKKGNESYRLSGLQTIKIVALLIVIFYLASTFKYYYLFCSYCYHKICVRCLKHEGTRGTQRQV